MEITTSRPYIIRALYEWILDNQLTPYIVVDANDPDSAVPDHLVQNGKIVFNISPEAVGRLNVSNDSVTFDASFSGVVRHILAPTRAVMAIYAQENGSGMMFHETGVPGEEDSGNGEPIAMPKKEAPKKPALRIVKDDEAPPADS